MVIGTGAAVFLSINMQVKMKKSKGERRRDISTVVSNKPLSKF